jgi:hypothetical protein
MSSILIIEIFLLSNLIIWEFFILRENKKEIIKITGF